jgi:hypothetical protein
MLIDFRTNQHQANNKVKKKEKVVLMLTDTLTRINQSWLSH